MLFVCSNPLFHDGKMTDCIPSDADLQKGFDGIPHFPGNDQTAFFRPRCVLHGGAFFWVHHTPETAKALRLRTGGLLRLFWKKGRMDKETKVLMQLVQTGNYSPRTAAKPASRSAMMSSMCSVPMDRRMVFW